MSYYEQPESADGVLGSVTSEVTLRDRWINVLVHLGINRNRYRVEPGMYSIGSPDPKSPVFVTANYSPSLRALRTALKGIDGWILVLDTNGINVWCAAGKGAFGTDELVHRIEQSGLRSIVEHRCLIVPQLGGPGVAAHEVKRRTGFRVRYGPVLAADLPAYLKAGKANLTMRRVKSQLRERLEWVPAELLNTLILSLILGVPLYFAGGIRTSLAVLASIFSGAVLFPLLLPVLPTPNFSTKGYVLGAVTAVPFIAWALFGDPGASVWERAGWTLAYALFMPSLTAFLSLNFTGSTPFTSWSGVRREILAYFPVMVWTFFPGIVLMIALGIVRGLGGGS
jgi:hypothetical protein